MKLYILRHGEAEQVVSSDSNRQLTDRGRRDVAAVIQRHADELSTLNSIWASPYVRAQQTAEIVSENFPSIPVQTLTDITPNNLPTDVLRFLCQQPSEETLLLVSHLPLVSELIANLCDLSTSSVSMHTAALASIELDPVASGMGNLNFID